MVQKTNKDIKVIIKMVLRTYCLVCKKHTDNYGSKNVIITNEVIRNKSRCSICLNDKSRFMKQKNNKTGVE